MVRVTDCVSVIFWASVTFIRKVNLPALVGLPVTTPVTPLNVNPGGNLLPAGSDHLYGVTPPVAANRTPGYFTLRTPSGSWVVAIVNGNGGRIVNHAVTTSLSTIFGLNAFALRVMELVMVIPADGDTVELRVGSVPSVV